MLQDLLEQACSLKRLDRDSAIIKLTGSIDRFTSDEIAELEKAILLRLLSTEKGWEERHGCLHAAKLLISNGRSSEHFRREIESAIAANLIVDPESRVRLACAEVLGVFCRMEGAAAYDRFSDRIISLIAQNLSRAEQSGDCVSSAESDAATVLHITAGWGCLETSMTCLQSCVEGCSTTFLPKFDATLFDLIHSATRHRNHFVRETAYQLLGTIGTCIQGRSDLSAVNALFSSTAIAETLASGLSDYWCPVQRAASVAVRHFLLNCCDDDVISKWLPLLIPPMCLNRFHSAEGVQSYSVETWISATKGNGLALVTSHLPQVVAYYTSQIEANHHGTRVACCQAISELLSKVNQSALEPQAGPLFDVLSRCLADGSGVVRDAACIALSSLLRLFPNVGRPSLITGILPSFLAQLHDSVPLFRQGAAECLASLVATYEADVSNWLLSKIHEGLDIVATKDSHESATDDEQSVSSCTLNSGMTAFVLDKRDGDSIGAPTAQSTHSCRYLTRALDARPCACCGESVLREPTPIEVADGTFHLIAELCALKQMHTAIFEHSFITTAFNLCSKTDSSDAKRISPDYQQLVVTICNCAPKMISGISKARFKPFLQQLIEGPLLIGLLSEAEPTRNAAENCLIQISQLFGCSVLRGRVEMTGNLRYLDVFDKIVR
uniref:HEAT repeat protein n=1 Tax=Plectus sambesii TaxID=2011161 RepID=A0A914W9R6_9BILA